MYSAFMLEDHMLHFFFLGGPVIHDFAFAVWVGVLTGTFSSIYVASPILILHEYWLNARRKAAKAAAAAGAAARK